MNANTGLLVEGMTVVATGGEEIGRVKEIRAGDFLLDMSMRRDLYVPFSAIRDVGGTVVLSVRTDEIGDQGWEPASLFGTPSEASEEPEPDEEDAADDLVVGTGDPAERGTWSASSDSYALDALDTTEGRQAIEGTDDGERPRSGDTTELEKLRDVSG